MADQEQALMEKLRVEPGEKIRLRDRNPRDKSLFGDEQETKAATRPPSRRTSTPCRTGSMRRAPAPCS